MKTVRIIIDTPSGRSVRDAVVCPGTDARRCGNPLTRPGECPSCKRRLTEDEHREATNRWRVVEEWEAA